ncbi:MAG: DUF4259 domain-containing protein [Lewinella sp.]
MGAWDTGIFDDDTAYEFFDDIEDNAKAFFTRSFHRATADDYLEYDDGMAALVFAAYLDNLLNSTTYDNDNAGETDLTNVNRFRELYSGPSLADLAANAINAVAAVRSGNSELRELWEENEELYLQWQQNLIQLQDRLAKAAKG